MGEIIASTYEVLKKIGEGGGGIVYLANHLRLNKLVVMKADKRNPNTRKESLSREVDLLKSLNHTYLPQVYDYFTENDTVYTVIDYIEGESLDKPLKRGEHFQQPQIVEWACEILEALVYLHGQTPGILHADIKPSNIMVTPKGDIRLIDFNISLIMKESGAVRVGLSWGYASPEHYSVDYQQPPTSGDGSADRSASEKTGNTGSSYEQTVTLISEEKKTVRPQKDRDRDTSTGKTTGRRRRTGRSSVFSSSTDQHKERTVLLDARSDIYSLGATLYHLMSGVRPPSNAKEVKPLQPGEFSAELCRIVTKAMALDPDQRYQSAAEMLYDLEHIHEHDPAFKRLRGARTGLVLVCVAAFLCGGALSLLGLQQAKRMENARVLASESRDALQRGDPVAAVSLAAAAIPEKLSLLDPVYSPEAQEALTAALGVYDLSDGFRAADSAVLSTEALKVLLSPQGTRLCAICAWELTVFDVASGEKQAVLPVEESALSCAVFLDEDRIAYAGPEALRVYDLKDGRELWQGKPATGLTLSADGNRIAAVYKDETVAYVYSTDTGELVNTVSFEGRRQKVTFNDTFVDPKDNLFVLNKDGSMLAASFADGGLYAYDLITNDYIEIYDRSDYTHFEGGFSGKYLAVSVIGGGKSKFTLLDMEELRSIGSMSGTTRFRLQVDETGVYIASDNVLVRFDPDTLTEKELAFTDKNIVSFRHNGDYTIVATEDKRFYIFDRSAGEVEIDQTLADYSCDHVDLADGAAVVGSMDSPALRLLRLEAHPETEILTYDPAYRHNEARLSSDGKRVMLFRFDRFRICDVDGNIICDEELPDAEHVYDQQFRRQDGESYLEVIWYDGTVRRYSAEDGAVLSEEQRDPPDESLYEEFFTSRYRITSPLHGTPVAYDRETGALVRELEKDAYMTYVTETGDYIVTEYITAQAERYGLLLDQDLQTLAVLPDLCDVVGERLIFDYASGDLRETHVYSLEELLKLAGR